MIKKVVVALFVFFLMYISYIGYVKYQSIFEPNVHIKEEDSSELFIPTGTTLPDLINIVKSSDVLKDHESFEWVAEKKNLKSHVYPGRYLLKNGMSNNELVNLLRSGNQKPVRVIVRSTRSKEVFSGLIAKQIESDSVSILQMLNEKSLFDVEDKKVSWMVLCIPNTYELFWNTNADHFFKRMTREYNSFWNNDRKLKSEKIGMDYEEVSVLASIVQQETVMDDEKPVVAGVYMNRLNKGMRLEADPTLIFAVGDFTIKRVLDKHKEVESPYNTYKYSGLPPGPICMPTISSIDAVLNYEKHKYLFFCAKEDFSGYHNFASSYSQHRKNARKFRRELNKRRIWN